MRRSRWLWLAVPCAALMAPATAAASPLDRRSSAKAPTALRAVSAPPVQAFAGDAFTLSARVRNTSRRTARPRLVVRLRHFKYAPGGRVVAAERLGRIKAGAAKRYRIQVKLPASLTAGRYYVVTCVRVRSTKSCSPVGRRIADGLAPVDVAIATGRHAAGVRPQTGQALRRPRPHRGQRVLREAQLHGSRCGGDQGPWQAQRLQGDRGRRLQGRVHRSQPEALPRGRVPEHGRRRAQRHRAGGVRGLLQQGGGFVGIGSAIETEPSWQFLTDVLGTRATGAAAAVRRRRQGRRPRPRRDARRCPSTGRAPTAATTSRPTSAASRTCSPRSSRIRSAAAEGTT